MMAPLRWAEKGGGVNRALVEEEEAVTAAIVEQQKGTELVPAMLFLALADGDGGITLMELEDEGGTEPDDAAAAAAAASAATVMDEATLTLGGTDPDRWCIFWNDSRFSRSSAFSAEMSELGLRFLVGGMGGG